MRRTSAILLSLALAGAVGSAQNKSSKTLDMYFIDTEGGHSTLYVSPSGESLLIDTGSPGNRDPDRIMAAIQAAGVTRIDHLLLTHYHGDHVGGLQELATRIPIAHFIDHGVTSEPKEMVPGFQKMYAEMSAKAKHTVVVPGDTIPFAGLTVTVVTSHGQVLKTPLAGGGNPNPACAGFVPRDESRVDPDNPMSVGVVIAYGKFRTVNLGDFTWNKEQELMCPNNPIGTVDLYLTSHHGIDQSGSAARCGHAQQRLQGRRHSNHADPAHLAGARRHLAAPLGLRGRPGAELAGPLHRQHRRRCGRRQRFAESSAHIWTAPRPGCPRRAGSAQRAHRPGILDQGVRASGRIV